MTAVATNPTYYEVLEIQPDASIQEIKAAYKLKLIASHPDKTKSTDTSNVNINIIQDSYRTLSDPVAREEYDVLLNKSFQKQGFNITGDGLDVYNLEEFDTIEPKNEEDDYNWSKTCPRCQTKQSINLTESDLENGTCVEDGESEYEIIVQCDSCSLWIKVKYYEA